jgi:hypothetical protein
VPRDQIDVRDPCAVDGGLIGDQANPLSPERRRQIGKKNLDAGPNRRDRGG